VASRRQSRDDGDVLSFLVEHVTRETPQMLASWPLGYASITALLLLSAWPLPSIRFLTDPSTMYASVALTACLYLGMHTGQGGHPEFRTPKWSETSDHEARHIWVGANIVAQRSVSLLPRSVLSETDEIKNRAFAAAGLPCSATIFNQPLDFQRRQGPPPDFLAYFEVLLEAQKFSNRVSRVMFAATEVSDSVSEQAVRMLEEEFDLVEQTLSRSQTGMTLLTPLTDVSPLRHLGRADANADLDLFTLLAVRLEIQTYYFAPSPKADKGALRRNIARAYHTARMLIGLAQRLEAAQAFLTHGPHHIFRSVLEAACVMVISSHSVYGPDLAVGTTDADMQAALQALRTCSVQEGDLAARAAKMMESYWSLRHLMPAAGLGLSKYRRRVGAVVVFDCLKTWKSNLEDARKAGGHHAPGGGASDQGGGAVTGMLCFFLAEGDFYSARLTYPSCVCV